MYKKQETVPEPFLREDLCFTYEQLNIVSLLQRLFTELAVFMRDTITGWIFNNPNYNEEAQSLMSIPSDFRDTLLVFYGPETADHFGNLMTNFISNVFIILEGFSSNNQELINQGTQKWYRDANTLSKFLDSINIFWTEPQWDNLFDQYIQLKLAMITSLYTGEYNQEQQIYKRVFDLATIMGNFMAQGLIARNLLRRVQQSTQTT